MKKIAFFLLTLLASAATGTTSAVAAPKMTVKSIHTVYHARAHGNSFFNARLRQKLENAGVRFVKDPKKADARLESRGSWTSNGGFFGTMTLKSRDGRLIWRETARRAPGSQAMAFETLGDKFRAARAK